MDFFSRADWFSGGTVPASANPFSIFGYALRGDRQYFYVVLAYVVVSYLLVTNLMRTRDGRALVAIRDHYLSAEIMGTLMGTAFVVLLPETMEFLSVTLKGGAIDKALSLNNNITFLREIAIGVIIIAFLMFEPDGLAHRWRQIKAYWKLYPFSH